LEGPAEKISTLVEKQADKIEEQREIDTHRINIKTEAKTIVKKFESKVEKIKKDKQEE